MSQESVSQQCSQMSRWTFTVNNYDPYFNFRQHFSKDEYKVKRAIFGYERGAENGTPHIQGYLELQRSYRLTFVKRIYPAAHWEAARRSAQVNFEYCSKSGNFDLIGDFSREQGTSGGIKRPASVSLVLRGLLNPKTAPQVRVSKEYADRHLFFDKAYSYVASLTSAHSLFQEWRHKKLYIWQYKVLKMLHEQGDRRVLWVVDLDGNHGKSFLASYLSINYGFHLFDGLLNTRDIGSLLDFQPKGFCFDIARASVGNFDYGCLESIKNGYLVSGKYRGTVKRFAIKPVVVFANNFPALRNLSEDRWNIQIIGQGMLSDLSSSAIVSPADEFPFVEPPSPPDLRENFNLRDYLDSNLEETDPPTQSSFEQPEQTSRMNISQVAGNSRFQEHRVTPSFAISQSTQTTSYHQLGPNPTRQRGIVMNTPTSPSEPPSYNPAPMHVVACPLHPVQGK